MGQDRELLRAYKVVLDPNPDQLRMLMEHTGAQRWAYCYALALKIAAHKRWQQAVAEHTYSTHAALPAEQAELAARATVKAAMKTDPALKAALTVPTTPPIARQWRTERGDEQAGVDGVAPWWRGVSSYAFSTGFRNADTAWSNWLQSLSGRRRGRRMGYPRMKRRTSHRSCTIFHDVTKPTIRVVDPRHVQIPRLGSIRLHSHLRRLVTKINSGRARIQSVTLSRDGHRWQASLLVAEPDTTPTRPTKTQRKNGAVGVDVGVHHLAALSDGTTVPNPRHLNSAAARLARAQRVYARTRRGSNNRRKAAARVARLHAQVATRRVSYLHQLTKRLATSWATVCVEDLNVAGMTRSARGTIAEPGRNVRAKSGLNRAILDASFSEVRRQLDYKTSWYGSRLAVADRFAATSKTCSACRTAKPELTLRDRVFTCNICGLKVDRDVNAARNIRDAAKHPDRWAKATPTTGTAGDDDPCPTPATGGVPEAHIGMPEEPDSATALPGDDAGRPPTRVVVTPVEQSIGVPVAAARSS